MASKMPMDKQKTIFLREFETLGYDSRADRQVSKDDFEEIRNFVLSKPVGGQSVLKLEHQRLKARNFVGILQTRRGNTIESEPKIDLAGADSSEKEKTIFLKMLQVWRDGPCKNMGDADIRTMKNFPLLEVFIQMFLADLLELTRRGLARSYSRVENNLRVLKGKLIFSKHIKHNLIHRERFYVQYEEFSANRPVNRLLKSTVLLLQRLSRSVKNQTLAHQARFYFEDIPESKNIAVDLTRAKVDRTMPLYTRLFPWVKLFLENSAPAAYQGQSPAFALLFPMEKIFEDYVAHRLRREMDGWKISTQEKILYLVKENPEGRREFQMRPDIVARKRDKTKILVMDTKWKRLNKNSRHHNISQSDLYQLYAYGKKYKKKYAVSQTPVTLYLLYPRNENFREKMSFRYENNLYLHVYPVRLDSESQFKGDQFPECKTGIGKQE